MVQWTDLSVERGELERAAGLRGRNVRIAQNSRILTQK